MSEDTDDSVGIRRPDGHVSPAESRGLLKQQLERQRTQSSVAVDEEEAPLIQREDETTDTAEPTHSLLERPSGIFERAPYLGSPFASSFGGAYGSLSSRFREPSAGHRGQIVYEPRGQVDVEQDKEQERLLLKVVEQEDGTKIQVVVGQSTLPQTVFNSINVLIGVGLLSLPLGLKQSGWLIGMLFLFFSAIVTRYTASVLAKCLDMDHSLISFSDLAWMAFGTKARIAVGLLFTLELIAACVALVILFADSLNALLPSLGITQWKILLGIIMIPLSFVPLRFLSFTSVLGILSCLGIVTLIFVDGFIKKTSPGSLLQPAHCPVWPSRWSELPLSFGLLMSPWGGHSVFPNIYRDMRHPAKYTRAINYTYVFTYLLDVAVAVAGYVMFGLHVHDEVTSNIFLTPGYPKGIAICIIVFISIIPITKIPLNSRPIFLVCEALCGLAPGPQDSSTDPAAPAIPTHDDDHDDDNDNDNENNPNKKKKSSSFTTTLISRLRKFLHAYTRPLLRSLIRTSILILITILSIIVPGFDTVMALLGSAMAFSICIILPLSFNLKLFGHELRKWEWGLNLGLIVICSLMAVVGTVWVFLPKGLREGLDGF